MLSLSKIGRIAIRLHRPIEGTPKTVMIRREADGWYVCFACADVPIQPLSATGQETGIDMGLESFATLASGQPISIPATIAWPKRTCAAANGVLRAARRGATAVRRR